MLIIKNKFCFFKTKFAVSYRDSDIPTVTYFVRVGWLVEFILGRQRTVAARDTRAFIFDLFFTYKNSLKILELCLKKKNQELKQVSNFSTFKFLGFFQNSKYYLIVFYQFYKYKFEFSIFFSKEVDGKIIYSKVNCSK